MTQKRVLQISLDPAPQRRLCGSQGAGRGRHRGLGITSSVMKQCEWVEPVLVAQVKFTEWTSDEQLRQPIFLGLRTDKQVKDVVREAG
jgi:ATP-dependent DNA ligase